MTIKPQSITSKNSISTQNKSLTCTSRPNRGGGSDANSLLNFINEKSTINGVVNAIKGDTIGGNLYFIAPQGIVVGSTGVINAGSIGLMTPTQDFYNELLKDGKIDQSKLTADAIKNIEAADIPLNLNGSISISGKLNAVDGIKVASAAIELKNEAQLVSTKEIDFSSLVNLDGIDSGLDSKKLKVTRSDDGDGAISLTAVADAAQLKNFENTTADEFSKKIKSIKTVDDIEKMFDDLTNVKATATVKVGAKSKIESDGAVTISATAKGDRHTDDKGNETNESVPWLNLSSKVEINGEVKGETVSINAKTEDTFKQTVQVKPEKKDDDKKDSDTENKDDKTSKDNAEENTDANSEKKDGDKKDGDTEKKDDEKKDSNLESKLGELMSKYLKLSGAYVVHNDEAKITVAKGATVTATGKDITDKKTDETTPALQISAESAPTIELTAKGETEEKNQLIAVTAAFINNSASVEINGALNSEGSADIKSAATSKITQTSTNKATAKDTSKLNFAGNVLIGNNKANLTLGTNSEINAGADVKAAANATETVKTTAEVAIKETGLGGSSINFVKFDSNADNTISGKVAKSGGLELSAVNEVNRTVLSNNGTEKVSTDSDSDGDKSKDEDKKTSTDTDKNDSSSNSDEEDEYGLAALFADTTEVAQEEATDEDAAPPADSDSDAENQSTAENQETAQTKTSALENAAKYLTVGASANVILGDDKATVTINKSADLTASDKLTIEAKNNLTDQKIGSIGQTSAGSSGENKKALVNAAVNVTNFDSDAAVLIKGGSINGGEVEINSSNIIADKRKADIIATIKRTKEEIEALTKSDTWSGYKDDLVAFKDSLEVAAKYLFSDETINPEDLKMTDEEINDDSENKTIEEKIQQKVFTDVMDKGLAVAMDGMTLYGTYNDSKTVLSYTYSLLDPSTYANFYADSSTTSTAVKNRNAGTAQGSSAASVAIAGAVNVNLSDDATRLVIGNGSKISSEGDVKINSVNSRDNVVADGHIKPTGAAATSIGAIVNVNNLNSTNVLAVAQGAELEGKSLDLKANNAISNIILNSGAGAAADKASTTGDNTTSANTVAVEGSISYVGGKSNALLSVDDGATLKTAGNLKLNAINDNDLYNIAGGLAYGHGAASVGVGLAISSFDVNTLAAIQNNDAGSTAEMIDLVKAAANADALFGSGSNGTFTAGNFVNAAETSGNMIALSVAGAAVEQQDKGSESSRTLENFGNGLSNKYKSLTDNKFVNFFKDKKKADKNQKSDAETKKSESESKTDKIKNSADKTTKNSGSNDSEKPKDKQASKLPNTTAGQDMPSITVTGAGSASVNLASIKTKSIVDGVTINSAKDFKVTASDSTNNAAASGAAALNFQQVGLSKNTTNSSTNVGIAGAVGWNKVTDDLKAIVQNSTINANSGNAEVSVDKGGALVAAGLGFSLTSTSRQNSKSVNVAANLSVNHAEESTYANISNSTINANSLTNSAKNSDVQVTGGINLAIAKGGSSANAIGGTVGYTDIENETLALIENGSKINLTGDLANSANTNIKQITGVVGASVATGAQKTNAFNGVLAYGKINNTADAKVDSSTITAKNLINRAFDGELSNSNVDYLEGAGIDTKGTDFLKNLADDAKAADSNVGTMSTNSTGNLQIVGAFDLTVATGSSGGTGLAAVTIGDIDNDFNAIVNNSTINGNVDADALSNSFAVNAAGGVAVSNNKFGGAGSVSWQTTDNQVKAAVTSDSNNTVSGNVDLNANSKAREVSVAGEIAVSKGTAVGLAMAYNNLNLTTATELKNITINGANVKATSANDGAIYAVGAGVNASKSNAISGSAAVNYGTNSATTNISGVTAANATTLETTAADSTYRLAIGGGANIAKTVAAGGAVVYNDIGTSGTNQQTKVTVADSKFAKLTGATIKATDNSTLKSIAAQLSGSGKVAANGSVAVTTIYKDVGNSITNSELAGKVAVDSTSTQDIFTTADAISVGFKAGIGAGVAVTNDHTKTATAFDGGSINGDDIKINSANTSALTNIAVGASGSANASISGSVSVNNLSGSTSATLNNTNVTATKNFAVTASGDETINNYAGALSLTGTGAAVGASVSVNNIANTTAATVTGGTINVTGNDSMTFKDSVSDGNIINTSISKDLFQTSNSLANLKTNSTYKGFLVDAVSTNTLKSFQICGGVAGTGASVGGTVNVQNIGGSTTAKVDNAAISGTSDVNILAHDYTNSEAMVGQIAITGTGAAVGAAIDIQTVTRGVNSELNAKSGSSINANTLKVDADSKQGIASLAVSGGIAGTGAAVNNATGVYNLKGTTAAKVSGLNGNANSLNVNANHLANLNSVGATVAIAGTGAGVGATVVILNETDTTAATVDNSKLTADTSNVAAKNALNLDDKAFAVSGTGTGAAVGGLVEVGNISNTVSSTVNNSTLGKSDAAKATVSADNTTKIKNIAGNGSLAGVGAAMGAGVEINTLDSQVSTNIKNSSLTAKDIAVAINDNKTIDQTGIGASLAGVGAGMQVGVMITNVGEKISDKYESSANKGSKKADGTQVDTTKSINTANNAVTSNLKIVNSSDSTVKNLGLKVNTDAATAGKGTAKGGVTNSITGSTLTAADTLKVTANGANNFTQNGVAAAVSGIGASASGSIGLVNFKYNTATDINSSTLTAAKNIDITTNNSGKNELKLATASVGGISGAVGVGYGDLTTKGNNAINLTKATIESTGGTVAIKTGDTTSTALDAKSFAVSGITSGGAVIGEVTSNATNKIDISGGSITGKTIDINASRGEEGKDTVNLKSVAVTAALGFSGSGLVADVDANDAVNVNVSNSAKLTADTINLNATNYQKTTTNVDAATAGLVSANVTKVTNKQSGAATVDVAKGVEFAAQNNNFTTNMNGVQNLDAFALSLGAGAAGYNESKLIDNATARAALNGANFTTSGANVNVTSNNSVTQTPTAKGVAGAILAKGTTRLETVRNVTNEISLVNGGTNNKFGTINAAANTNTNTTINVKSGTGGLTDSSPEAAYLDDAGGNTTKISVGGDFNATNINLTATTTEKENRSVDATSASVAGRSGATSIHKDTSSTSINVADKSSFTTSNDLNFSALNNITSKSDLTAAGYGGVRGNAADNRDTGAFSTAINLGNATTFKTDKDFTAKAADVLDVKSSNLLKSKDLGSSTVANSTNIFELKNSVTGGKNTINAENINMQVGESGKLNLATVADHVGGAGSVKTQANNIINRTDTITFGENSAINAKEINLATKTGDKLDLNLQSDVFNYSLIPLKNSANMDLSFNQNNSINVGKGAKVLADEAMTLDASGNVTNVAKSVRYYSTYSNGGQKTTSNTDGNEKISAMRTNNVVNVNGTVEAGSKNKLGIEITDNTATITDGKDWFTGKVTFKNGTTKNPYYARWQAITEAMKDYPTNSDQYKALDNERASLITTMSNEGFLKNGQPIENRTENNVAVLPNIRVSGADIKLYGEKLEGTGSITAHRGSNINILRKSGGAIEVSNSVTFGNLGGIVMFNDAVAKADDTLKITSELNDVTPVINIENRSSRSDTNSPDINISGLIDNPAGNVKISTNHGSINARGMINAQIVTMSAPNGNFSMIDEKALVNLSDPITYFTLGDKDISNYVQKRVAVEAAAGNKKLTFNDTEGFGNWLYDTLTLYKQPAILSKYGNASNKSAWVNSYVQRINDQIAGGKIIAGGDILIQAKDINVNGLIQSGFTKYTGEVDTTKVNSISSNRTLTDDEVLGNSNYLVTKNYNKADVNDINSINGVVKNSDGYYDKQLELYYNPSTGHIVANDIYSTGGNVTLKGNIISTGGGKIVVSNGAADVEVKNDSDQLLKISNIESTESKGMVKITDNYNGGKESTYSSNSTYSPLKNTTYNWSGGGNYTWHTNNKVHAQVYELSKIVGIGVWTLGRTLFGGSLQSFINRYGQVIIDTVYNKREYDNLNSSYTPYSTADAIRKNGVYISKGNGEVSQTTSIRAPLNPVTSNSATPYLSINTQTQVADTKHSDISAKVFGRLLQPDFGLDFKWTETQTGTANSTYAMKADNPIDIKFVKGNSKVTLSSMGGVNDTTVTAKSLTLTNSFDNGGDMNVNFNTIGDGALDISTHKNASVTANVNGSLKNFTISESGSRDGEGDVTINATGDIIGKDSGWCRNLTLNSSKGKVDLLLDGGRINNALDVAPVNLLNVSAAGNVSVRYNQAQGNTPDLRIGTIESKTGDVSITTKGNLVNAATAINNPTETQIANWKELGIMDTWNEVEVVNSLNGNVFSDAPYTIDLAPVANIIANTVTFDVGGSIGSTGTSKTISYSNLNTEENLKLLSDARVGDLVWGDNSVTYTPHNPIGVTLRDNTDKVNLSLKGGSNEINIAAADDKTGFIVYSDNVNHQNANITLAAAAGIKTSYSIQAKNLTLRGGYGDIDVNYNITTKSPIYLDAITGGDLKVTVPGSGQSFYITNAIAGGNLTLRSIWTTMLKNGDTGYLSAGTGKELNIAAFRFGNDQSSTPNILANGEYLTLSLYIEKPSLFFKTYLNGITREDLENKIYINNLRTAFDAKISHYSFSPENVFVWKNQELFKRLNKQTEYPGLLDGFKGLNVEDLRRSLPNYMGPHNMKWFFIS